jgi:hypothetical protein
VRKEPTVRLPLRVMPIGSVTLGDAADPGERTQSRRYRGNAVASVARGAAPEQVVCAARCVSLAAGFLVQAAAVITRSGGGPAGGSVCEQDGDEHVRQPVLVGGWVAA